MNPRTHRLCVWCAPAGFVLLFAAFLLASWFPFPSPDRSAASVARMYQQHTDGIRLAAVLLTAGAALVAPLSAVIAVQMRRVEGKHSPLAFLELGMGCCAMLAVSITSFFWWTAAFRPERDPVVTQSWHDAGWLCITAVVFIFIAQLAAVAAVILTDPAEQALFPRWLGYLTAWVAVLLLPSLLCLWFKTGAFAWNGVATLYLAFAAVGVWFAAMVVTLLRQITAQAASA
jgi:hypothetical protein